MKLLNLKTISLLVIASVSLLWAAAGRAQSQPESGIQWYATLASGLAEAKRSNRPILFTSAAPNCAGVSGIW